MIRQWIKWTTVTSYYKFSQLEPSDRFIFVLYIGISIAVLSLAEVTLPHQASRVIAGYALLTQLFLYAFLYRALRNLSVFCLWAFIGIVHLLLSFSFKGNSNYHLPGIQVANSLRDTIIMLLFFQVLRLLSLLWQKQELIPPFRNRLGKISRERLPTIIDFLFFFIYIALAVYLAQVNW